MTLKVQAVRWSCCLLWSPCDRFHGMQPNACSCQPHTLKVGCLGNQQSVSSGPTANPGPTIKSDYVRVCQYVGGCSTAQVVWLQPCKPHTNSTTDIVHLSSLQSNLQDELFIYCKCQHTPASRETLLWCKSCACSFSSRKVLSCPYQPKNRYICPYHWSCRLKPALCTC